MNDALHKHQAGALALDALVTPCLLLDLAQMRRNIARMAEQVARHGVALRPHVKTHKSTEVMAEIRDAGHVAGITVSTLREAEYFFDRGYSDILYAVGIVPTKLAAVAGLRARGCNLKIILDSTEMAREVVSHAERHGITHRVMLELDTDGHRAGVRYDDDALLEMARILSDSDHCEMLGVMTHAGESYGCRDQASLLQMARQERDQSIAAAERLREQGLPCPVVSIGSTPTALAIDSLEGVTEVRAGVYVFFDLVMAGIGVCAPEDIALSVLVSIAGHQQARNWALSDGGWMAMSRDRGTGNQSLDYGYGAVLDASGAALEDLIVKEANQEHGIISRRDGDLPLPFEQLPLGGLLRILPNHACATAAQFDEFIVIDENGEVIDRWHKTRGW